MSSTNATMAVPEFVTDDNKAPLIRILAAFFLCLVVLACFARNMTKIWMTKTMKLEDWFALAATVCCRHFSTRRKPPPANLICNSYSPLRSTLSLLLKPATA